MKFIAVILVLITSLSDARAACDFDIEVGDSLVFSISEMSVESTCEMVNITLSHTGNMPVAAMGHNWVLAKEAEYQAIAMAGISAGVGGNYLPDGDERIIAATKLIGGGEVTSLSFSIGNLDSSEAYAFFCSFPGHWGVMKGVFKIV
ncbi:MAG: azurin [Woeseia sp.]|nr:azurin [Woeseia sp.]|tara:strand:+ start:1003 stop:1443 length:441 start_codon:yes stop_codon:yes gene_type:complete